MWDLKVVVKKRCKVCVNVCETDTFSSAFTGETFKINHKLNCDDKCLICLFTCEYCGKQYIGESTGEFRFRWNNYKYNDRKYTRNEDCFQEHLFETSKQCMVINQVCHWYQLADICVRILAS